MPHRASLRVLVVGTEPELTALLRDHGLAVEHAVPSSAAASLLAGSFQAAFLPADASGCEVATIVRRANRAARPRLIALTPSTTSDDFTAFRTAGFDLHLTMPIRSEQLVTAMLLIRMSAI